MSRTSVASSAKQNLLCVRSSGLLLRWRLKCRVMTVTAEKLSTPSASLQSSLNPRRWKEGEPADPGRPTARQHLTHVSVLTLFHGTVGVNESALRSDKAVRKAQRFHKGRSSSAPNSEMGWYWIPTGPEPLWAVSQQKKETQMFKYTFNEA